MVGYCMSVRKWSVSVRADLAERVTAHVGSGNLSGFVSRAMEHELERERLAGYLHELDEEYGKAPCEEIEKFDNLWPR